MFVFGLLADPDTPSITRLLLVGALSIAIYHGHDWARWIFLIVVVVAEFFIVYSLLTTSMPQLYVNLSLAFALIGLVFVALLFVPSLGGQYFRSPKSDSNTIDPTDS